VYEEEGQGKRAQDLYERVLKLDPNHTAALQQIGVVYGQNGDLTRAHLYTGLHYKRNGQYEKAWQQMKLAKSHAKNAPYDVQDRIEQELRQLQKDKFEEEKEKEGERTEERRRRGPVYKRIVP
jgi:predicted Zn-dependent protease